MNYSSIIQQFKQLKVLVVGDVILDRYIQGHVSRISPEAPVPVVLEEETFVTPGGAANVAHNLSALGCAVTQLGVIGQDTEGQLLKKALKDFQVDVDHLVSLERFPTISKTRVIAQHQQVVRIDREQSSFLLDEQTLKLLSASIAQLLPDMDAVIISDYGKGLITTELIAFVRTVAHKYNVILTVDPKVEHFSYYRGVTGITPNKNEAENAIRNIKIRHTDGESLNVDFDCLDSLSRVDQAGEALLNFLSLDSLLITLGEQGMRLFEKGKPPLAIQTQAREVFDVTGAGDAVISVFTSALAAGASKEQAAQLSNLAGGIVVGKMGAVAVTAEELHHEFQQSALAL